MVSMRPQPTNAAYGLTDTDLPIEDEQVETPV